MADEGDCFALLVGQIDVAFPNGDVVAAGFGLFVIAWHDRLGAASRRFMREPLTATSQEVSGRHTRRLHTARHVDEDSPLMLADASDVLGDAGIRYVETGEGDGAKSLLDTHGSQLVEFSTYGKLRR